MASAVAGLSVFADPLRLVDTLVQGLGSDDPLVTELAATGLARFAPEHEALTDLGPPPAPEPGEPSRSSLMVHGTVFGKHSVWWQPGGDFHTYVLNSFRPDLYASGDRFQWTGRYSDAARALAARDLHDWLSQKRITDPTLFTHSHGGSVAMLASQNGLDVDQLVLLSCPVHAQKYLPDFTRVQNTVSIRVRLDLVILADRGGQRFRDPRIRETVLPLWFDHGASHDPDVWRQHNLPSKL